MSEDDRVKEARAKVRVLAARFKVANVPGRGPCIIIPSDKFEPEWDQIILDADLESHAEQEAVYVTWPTEETAVPEGTPSVKTVHGRWSEEEDAFLIKEWSKPSRPTREEVFKEFQKHFKGRSRQSIHNRLARLRRKGLIKGRYVKKSTVEKEHQLDEQRRLKQLTARKKRCQWVSCKEIATELGHISLPGGPAAEIWLCKKHHEQLKQITEKWKNRSVVSKPTKLVALEITGASIPCPHCGEMIKINFKIGEVEFVK